MIDLLVNPGQDWQDVHREEYNNDIEMARGFKGIQRKCGSGEREDGVYECGEVVGPVCINVKFASGLPQGTISKWLQ